MPFDITFFLLFFLAPLFCGNFEMKLVVKLRNWSHDWRLWVDVGGCLIREISFYLILYIHIYTMKRISGLSNCRTWHCRNMRTLSRCFSYVLRPLDVTSHTIHSSQFDFLLFISNFFRVCYLTVKTKYLLDLKNSSSVHPCYAIKRLCMCSWKPLHLLAWEQYNTRSKSKYMIILFLI